MSVILMAVSLQAQWNFGVKAGINFANVNPTELYGKTQMSIGPMAGAVVGYTISDWIDIQAEPAYSRKGYKDKDLVVMSGVDGVDAQKFGLTVTADYVELPLLVKFYPFQNIGVNVQAGPNVGLLINRSYKVGKDKDFDMPFNGSGDERFKFGMDFGIGYTASRGMFIDLRYNLGLTNSYKDLKCFQDRTFAIQIGYMF